MDFGKTSSFDQIIQFTQCSISWQRLEIGEQIMLFVLEQTPIDVVVELVIPKCANINACNFRSFEYL
jgi:hypothetical protein